SALKEYVVGDIIKRQKDYSDAADKIGATAKKLIAAQGIVSNHQQGDYMKGLTDEKKAELNALYLELKNIAIKYFEKDHKEAAAEEVAGRKKSGLKFLYWDHVFKPLTNIEKFWGMEGYKAKFFKLFAYYIPAFTLAAIVIELVFSVTILPLPLAVHTLLATAAATLYPVIFGFARNWKQKFFWGSIFGIFSLYYGGAMVGLLFQSTAIITLGTFSLVSGGITLLIGAGAMYTIYKSMKSEKGLSSFAKTIASVLTLFGAIKPRGDLGKGALYVAAAITLAGALTLFTANAGFFITVFLLALTALPTLASIYHLVLAIKSYYELQDELFSKTVRSLVGFKSLNPFTISPAASTGFTIVGMTFVFALTLNPVITILSGIAPILLTTGLQSLKKTVATFKANIRTEAKTVNPVTFAKKLIGGNAGAGVLLTFAVTGSLTAALLAGLGLALIAAIRAGDYRDYRIPVVGLVKETVKTLVPFGTPAKLKVGGTAIGLMLAGIVTGNIFAVAAIAAVTVVVRALSPRSRATFWEVFYGNVIAEIEAIEADNTLVLENGESVREYLERQIIRISQQYLLTTEEKRLWLAALRGEEGGRFVLPQGEKARQTLYDIFFALGHKKTTGDVLALMEASSSHTQAAWEIFSNTPISSMFLGIFNKNPESGKLTTLLGYNARKLSEWQSVVDDIEREFSREYGALTASQTDFVNKLRDIHEEMNLIDIIYRDRYGVFQENEALRNRVVGMMMRFLNEQRPTHGPVAESMATDILEYHLNVSEQLGDFAYNRFVQALLVSGEFTSVKDAFVTLSRLSDEELRNPATLAFLADAIQSSEEERVAMARAFLANFNEYQAMVDTKLRNIIHMEPIWRTNGFRADKTIEKLGQLSEFMKLLTQDDRDKDTKEITRESVLTKARKQGRTDIVEMIERIMKLKSFTKFQGMSIPEWAALFAKERDEHQRELMLILNYAFEVQMSEFQAKIAAGTEAELDAVNDKDEQTLLNEWDALRGAYDKAEQTAEYVNTLIKNGVDYSLYDVSQDVVIMNNKNGGMATNLWLFFDKSVSYDAHVRTTLGQNVWRPVWATMQARDVEIAVVNPMMRIWASNGDAWEGTRAYAISQETWTSEVQRGRKEYTTFYGKGLGLWHTFTTVYTPPGEDTAAFMTQQRSQPRWKSTHIDWYGFEWGRPNLLAESLVATETRYA
ncbi:MAG: hypothetical protein KC897_05920, partial [Candidatus Omnitrophica bacterium]|nr:hypothetical protein [Candidatus Omnitrophota bacterium]